jgi:hypothetical protein
VNELYRPRDRRLSAKLVPTFVDGRCNVVSVTDPYCFILGFLNQEIIVIAIHNYKGLALRDLKHEMSVNIVPKFSSCLTENTQRLY